MKIKALLMVAGILCATTSHAQLDTWMMNQWLNQMQMDNARMQQQMTQQLLEMLNQQMQEWQENATATALMLPGGNDLFYAYITAGFIGLKDLDIQCITPSGRRETIPASECFAANGIIITPAKFTPGSSIVLTRKSTGETLDTSSIPDKSSSSYNTYVMNAYTTAQILGGGSVSGYGSGSSSGGGSSVTHDVTCSLCHGTGWIAGSSTPTYGNGGTHWCGECGREVPASHSHDRCPSCGGKGYITKIR